MQQVGKRTIGHGNSGSYYSGADHCNQIKFNVCHWSIRKKCEIWISNWKVDTLESVWTSFYFGFEFVPFVNLTYLKLSKFRCAKRPGFSNSRLAHRAMLKFYQEVDFRGMGQMSWKNVVDVTFSSFFSMIFWYQPIRSVDLIEVKNYFFSPFNWFCQVPAYLLRGPLLNKT